MKVTKKTKRKAYLDAIDAIINGQDFICNQVLMSIGLTPYINGFFSTKEDKYAFLAKEFPELISFQPTDSDSSWLYSEDINSEERYQLRLLILAFCLELSK